MAIKKDYYRILNIKSSASAGEIKSAYRKLAMKYHPDRNAGDALSAAIFSDVAEAYNILSDATLRRQYNEERHLTAAQEYERPVETMEKLIQRITEINKRVATADPFRFNKDALLYTIKQLFPSDVNLLLDVNQHLLEQFLEKIIISAERLPSHQTKQLITLLQPYYKKHEWLQQKLTALIYKQQKEERWEKNKIALAVLIAVILCIVIFLAAGN